MYLKFNHSCCTHCCGNYFVIKQLSDVSFWPLSSPLALFASRLLFEFSSCLTMEEIAMIQVHDNLRHAAPHTMETRGKSRIQSLLSLTEVTHGGFRSIFSFGREKLNCGSISSYICPFKGSATICDWPCSEAAACKNISEIKSCGLKAESSPQKSPGGCLSRRQLD